MSHQSLLPQLESAILALADGTYFQGISIGASGEATGEVVFNTGMTGYQEILTDPSYCRQIVTLTYPHIGNTGINLEDNESSRAQVAGLVIRELSPIVSNWRATESLSNFLKRENIIAIAGIDTRALTRLLREKGAQSGCILTGKNKIETAIEEARGFSGITHHDLTNIVTTKSIYTVQPICTTGLASKSARMNNTPSFARVASGKTRDRAMDGSFSSADEGVLSMKQAVLKQVGKENNIVVIDFGVKQNILRMLSQRNCRLTVVPATTTSQEIIALKPDGVLLSNGPGDPAACTAAIHTIQELLSAEIPLFGICLGFQLLALACGAKTRKMKFGHHGINHPVQSINNKKVFITSQNHGFCVDAKSLSNTLVPTHISLFDGTLQGFAHREKIAMAFQGHPEASPGPAEISILFDEFIQALMQYAKTQ